MIRFIVAFALALLTAAACSSRTEAQAQSTAEDEATCRSYGVEPTATFENVFTIGFVRDRWPVYKSVPDLKLADAVYRKFHYDMPRATFDSVFWRNSIEPQSVTIANPVMTECKLRAAEIRAQEADASRRAASLQMMITGLSMMAQPAPRSETTLYNFGGSPMTCTRWQNVVNCN